MSDAKKKTPHTQAARAILLLQYLRKNSDPQHPVKLGDIDKYFAGRGLEGIMGDKKTRRSLIKQLEQVLNSEIADNEQPLPQEQWRIVYREILPDENEDEETDAGDTRRYSHITGLYYNPEFTAEEVHCLEEGLAHHPELDLGARIRLTRKLKEHLASKFYQSRMAFIEKVYQPCAVDKETLYHNLELLQKALRDRKKVRYIFNGYDHRKRLIPARREKYTVSPYYVAAYGGRYYLLGVTDGYQNLSIWRVELMSELEVTGLPSPAKREAGVPETWDERFPYEHLNMFYDEPVNILLRVRNEKPAPDPRTAYRPGYTFLYDWFGDTFHYVRTEAEPPYDDIVQVKCSPEAMVHWALQYSERVEVVSPAEVRAKVAERVRALNETYLKK